MAQSFQALASVTAAPNYPRLDTMADQVASGTGTVQQARLVLRALRSIREYQSCIALADAAARIPGARLHVQAELLAAFSATENVAGIEGIAADALSARQVEHPLLLSSLNALIDIGETDAAARTLD